MPQHTAPRAMRPLLAILAAIALTIVPLAHAAPAEARATTFRDTANSPFANEIEWLYQQGITRGCGKDRFCPRDPVTRQEMAAFLGRYLGLTRTSGHQYRDVPRGSTFVRDIDALATAGITRGTNRANTHFSPRREVTREQMASVLVRGLNLTESSNHSYRDVPRGSTHARDINLLATSGITRGVDRANTRFDPNRPVTREQMAAFLYPASQLDGSKPSGSSHGRSAPAPAPSPSKPSPPSSSPAPSPSPSPSPPASSPAPSEPSASVPATELSTSNTGYQAAGLSLNQLQSVGSITTSRDNQVIENVDVTGSIRVQHRNVTIRNSRVRHSGGYGISAVAGANVGTVTITNVEIDGRGVADGIGVYVTAPVNMNRVRIHGQRVGTQISSGSSVTNSYIHNQAVASGTHNTAMSSHGAQDLTIRNNRLESSTSASLSLYPRLQAIRNVTVEGNLFEGGGRGIGLYAGYTSNHPYRDQNRDIRIINNRWTGSFQHGTHLAWNGSQPGNVWRDNRWLNGNTING